MYMNLSFAGLVCVINELRPEECFKKTRASALTLNVTISVENAQRDNFS